MLAIFTDIFYPFTVREPTPVNNYCGIYFGRTLNKQLNLPELQFMLIGKAVHI